MVCIDETVSAPVHHTTVFTIQYSVSALEHIGTGHDPAQCYTCGAGGFTKMNLASVRHITQQQGAFRTWTPVLSALYGSVTSHEGDKFQFRGIILTRPDEMCYGLLAAINGTRLENTNLAKLKARIKHKQHTTGSHYGGHRYRPFCREPLKRTEVRQVTPICRWQCTTATTRTNLHLDPL
jgi:hypothetical protein